MATDLDPRLVYAKTARGVAEVASRSLGLGPAARRILILLDGRRRLADLPPFARPGELEPIVEDLLSRELIALAGISETAEDVGAPDRLRLQRETLERLQLALAGRFQQELGNAGLVLEARLRDCVSLDVMRPLLREGIDAVVRQCGPAAGERLLAIVRPVYAEFTDTL